MRKELPSMLRAKVEREIEKKIAQEQAQDLRAFEMVQGSYTLEEKLHQEAQAVRNRLLKIGSRGMLGRTALRSMRKEPTKLEVGVDYLRGMLSVVAIGFVRSPIVGGYLERDYVNGRDAIQGWTVELRQRITTPTSLITQRNPQQLDINTYRSSGIYIAEVIKDQDSGITHTEPFTTVRFDKDRGYVSLAHRTFDIPGPPALEEVQWQTLDVLMKANGELV